MTTSPLTVDLADGAALHVEVDGSGPDVVLMSGLGGSAAFWAPLVGEIASEHRAIRFDQRGIGASTRGEAATTIEELARDALAVMDACGSRRATCVGHSTGGCIVQEMARQAPDRVERLVLSGTWLGPNRYMEVQFEGRLALLGASPRHYAALTHLSGHPPEDLEDFRIVEDAMAAAPVGEAAQRVVAERIAALLAFDSRPWTHEISIPRLVIGASDDMIVPMFLQRELAAAAPCDLHALSGGGHFYPQTRPTEFADALRSWWTP
ncbi:alpha/beta fold hydrolase [Acuticoccus sp.]|uniref:alpha/beta fold hydrolase n=1 Tax=Acuticoccus sp. TaxID=1904378 RepID=UPI003B51C3CB